MPEPAELAAFLGRHPPFEALDDDALGVLAAAASVRTVAAGEVVLDAFRAPSADVFVVREGAVDLWNDAARLDDIADERLGPGGVFGYSAMLSGRSIGPRAVASGAAVVVQLPADVVTPAFSSRPGVRFLAGSRPATRARVSLGAYAAVDDLLQSAPVSVAAGTPIGEVARVMDARGCGYAAVELGDGRFGLVTDAVLRRRVLVQGAAPSTAVEQLMIPRAPTARTGESAAEALITMLDAPEDYLLVVDRDGGLRGVIIPRDFMISPSAAGVTLHEQVRRAGSVDELVALGAAVPGALEELLARDLAASRVITVHSATIDAFVRRAIQLVFAGRPELTTDAFTWLSLGSNGRREAVPASDIDAAVAYATDLDPSEQERYRTAFAAVDDVLAHAGFRTDRHGAVPQRAPFARTNAAWRSAARGWLDDPVADQGAIMTSLLVDARPIHGDPGLPAVTEVFRDLRAHPGTMRLLLSASLAARARLRSVRDVLAGRGGTFDLKAHALVPVVNIARWAALSVGAIDQLATVDRLRAAGGSPLLQDEHAATLVEAFEVLQRLRLRHQLDQLARGDRASDIVTMHRMSAIDRSTIGQAVREIGAVQRAMANAAQYVAMDE